MEELTPELGDLNEPISNNKKRLSYKEWFEMLTFSSYNVWNLLLSLGHMCVRRAKLSFSGFAPLNAR